MATQFCPECHRPLPKDAVEGVNLTRLKASLFRYIEAHPGQTSTELGYHFYSDSRGSPARAVRSHIHQINEALADVGVRIQGGHLTGYHIVRQH